MIGGKVPRFGGNGGYGMQSLFRELRRRNACKSGAKWHADSR
jgi:hypothetical protein